MDYRLEVLVKMRCGHDVEECGSLADEFERRGWFGIEVSAKVLGEKMDKVNDAISHGISYIAVGCSLSSEGRTAQLPFGWLGHSQSGSCCRRPDESQSSP